MKTKCIVSAKKKTKDKKEKTTPDLITVILLCDSSGYRMKSYGPVSLVTINDIKLIDLQIQCIRNVFENFEIILCVGFDAEKICKYIRSEHGDTRIRIVENQLHNVSNSCESLRLSLNNTTNNKVVVCDGNLILNEECLRSIDTDCSCVLVEEDACENLEIGLNIDDKQIVQHLSYGANNTWSEIFFLNGLEIIESLRKIVTKYDSKTRFVFESINELIKMKYEVKSMSNKNKVIKINNIKMYHSIKGNNV
jgi:hypothetical protein